LAYLSHLRLTNFRNLVELDLELTPGVSVYFGPNAQGKTTLLEAVYLLSIARSFRAENEREVVNFAAARSGGQALVDGTVERADERLRVIVGYQVGEATASDNKGNKSNNGLDYNVRKDIRVNRLRRTAAELVGTVNAVLFSALDLDLVQGPPSGRRRFLDILLSQADSLYLKGLQRYNRVVQQRNQLLRLLREGRAGADELSFWDDELVREGAWLTWRRYEIMKEVTPSCLRHHTDLSGPTDELAVEYRPSVAIAEDADGMEDCYRLALAEAAPRERAQATTVVGPHRDDFNLMIDGIDMGTFASRGQARTLALTLRLAEAEVLASVRGEGPIVLLDDALSEIDSFRRNRVLEKTSHYQQVLITTTDLEQVSGYFGSNAVYHEVIGGRVLPYDTAIVPRETTSEATAAGEPLVDEAAG
jgi:DNA replication and repair protein RecF